LKPISTAGGPERHPGRLELKVDSKVFRSADGVENEVLRDFGFTLTASSFTCLIGPSGCGKTTTLRIILGLDRAFDGKVRLMPADLRLAAVFQEPRLLPWRTVEQNVRLAIPSKGQDKAQDLDELFRVLGLEAMRERYPGELSLGLARRVALARAFAVMPDILLLDEPFVSLDEHTADRLRAHLVELWQTREATVLMVTHNVHEAARLADRLLLMNERPARLVGDVTVPVPRAARSGATLRNFLDSLSREHPETVLA